MSVQTIESATLLPFLHPGRKGRLPACQRLPRADRLGSGPPGLPAARSGCRGDKCQRPQGARQRIPSLIQGVSGCHFQCTF